MSGRVCENEQCDFTEALRGLWNAERREFRTSPLSGSAAAFLAWRAATACKTSVVAVAENSAALEELRRALDTLRPEGRAEEAFYYPAPGFGGETPLEANAARVRALAAAAQSDRPFLMAASVQAAMLPAPRPETARNALITFRVGMQMDSEKTMSRLAAAGFGILPEVDSPAQAARRGGILDLWPPGEKLPARIELLGNRVESIRLFDPANQLSVERLDAFSFVLADATASEGAVPLPAHFAGRPVLWLWLQDRPEPAQPPAAGKGRTELEAQADMFLASAPEFGSGIAPQPLEELYAEIAKNKDALQLHAAALPAANDCFVDLGFRSLSAVFKRFADSALLDPDAAAKARGLFLGELEAAARKGMRIFCFFDTDGALSRFKETHPQSCFVLRKGVLPDGFAHERLRLAFVSESDLSGRRLKKTSLAWPGSAGPDRSAAKRAEKFWAARLNIEPGELVVHEEHGIGRYLGLREVTVDGKKRESIAMEYADNVKLFVPVSQAHLLSRYIGIGGRATSLHKLGGVRWRREKESAEEAVRTLAAELIRTHAARQAMPGHAFGPDTPWQLEFEHSFPYQETEDQRNAVADVKRDMENPQAMDRIVCGDAGYGKTEVAMRAAFKAAMDGKQTAVLAPTTVLAQQHYELFAERMAMYPLRVELLCRLRPRKEQEQVAAAVNSGAVDIVIGTHRLLGRDVQFKNLGLLVIDEEQRFGVAHKELLKRQNRLVDVLTLSATPIPRTLYMSLTGIKDISMVQTPPFARQNVETVVADNDDETIRAAIARELGRNGQVYFLHNRIRTIEKVRARLRRLAPEARIEIAHGRMPAAELASTMRRFEAGEFDVLLCTTIIESGIDIPNVNTVLVDRADRFGMAELYQLRGRVGRSARKAYAYLLLPPGEVLDAEARRRLRALMEHTGPGAAFQLAVRDLEIRGAGNLLGREQSGHIAAIGFDLYCRLLRAAVDALSAPESGRKPLPRLFGLQDVELRLDFAESGAVPAGLPWEYVEDERIRLELYRKIAAAVDASELMELERELRDRFGPPPPEAETLLKTAAVRAEAAAANITSIEVKDSRVMLKRGKELLMSGGRLPRLRTREPQARLEELLWLVRAVGRANATVPADA